MIKFSNKNLRKISTILLSGTIVLSISGCGSKVVETSRGDYSSNSETTSNLVSSESGLFSQESIIETAQVEESSKSSQESVIETAQIEESSELVESFIESKVEFSKDSSYESIDSRQKFSLDDVADTLNNIDNKITNGLYVIGDELLEDYDILYDFIFENGTIKGYTFDEVKDDIQASAMSVYLKLDKTIDDKFPNTKKKIQEVYGNTKNKVKNKLSEFKGKIEDKIIDEIGEEEYSNYIEMKDDFVSAFKDQTKSDIDELKGLGKEFLKGIRER